MLMLVVIYCITLIKADDKLHTVEQKDHHVL